MTMDPSIRRSSSSAGASVSDRSLSLSPPASKKTTGPLAMTAAGRRKNALAFLAAVGVAVLAALLLLSGDRGRGPTNATASSGGGRTSANIRGIDGGRSVSGASNPRPLVVAGPSGVGKGTLIGMLLDHYNSAAAAGNNATSAPAPASRASGERNYFGLSVSHTTRGPRPGEEEGVHYHFTTRERLQSGIDKGEFVEWNEVHGNLYGTSYASIKSISSSGLIPIIEVDVQGVKRIKESGASRVDPPLYLFISPPSLDMLEKRLRGRATETEEAVRTRLGNAAREIEYGRGKENFDRVLVHEDVSTSFPELIKIMEGWYPHLKGVKGNGFKGFVEG